MLVACRLAGLSALESIVQGSEWQRNASRVWLRGLACRPAGGDARLGESYSDVILRLARWRRRGGVDRLGRPQTHLRIAARRGAQKPGLVDMVSPIFLAPASVFTEAGGV
jgi:hypothetical protein